MSKVVFIAGHNGMVGSALVRQLQARRDVELLLAGREQLDLTNQAEVQAFFVENKIDQVYLAAARVGGIIANSHYPADFIYDNLLIQCNVINSAFSNGVKKLLFLGSSCIYPKHADQPMSENALLTGPLEPTNEPYALAKITGIKLCESYNRQYGVDYRSVMPTNLYGVNDNFHPENSHVIPALLARLHKAKMENAEQVVIWGSGEPKREFLNVDDMADACVFVMDLAQNEYQTVTDPRLSHLNVGTGQDCSIRELAETIARVVAYKGELVFDKSKPNGPPRKLLNTEHLSALGWHPKRSLEQGLKSTYSWFKDNQDGLRGTE